MGTATVSDTISSWLRCLGERLESRNINKIKYPRISIHISWVLTRTGERSREKSFSQKGSFAAFSGKIADTDV
jgi:hypothetical protein